MTKEEKQKVVKYLNNGGAYDDLPLKTQEALRSDPHSLTDIDRKEIEQILEETEKEVKTTMTKDLKERAIRVQGGKEYVLVSDRILYFNETYPNGRISTELLSAPDSDKIAFKAIIIPDVATPERYYTGHSQAVVGVGMVNKTAALENAETSAIGRALGMMGIGVIESIASVDELVKAGAFDKQEEQDWTRETEETYHSQEKPKLADEGQACSEHSIAMQRAVSKKTNKPYWYHRSADNQMCFGRGYKE